MPCRRENNDSRYRIGKFSDQTRRTEMTKKIRVKAEVGSPHASPQADDELDGQDRNDGDNDDPENTQSPRRNRNPHRLCGNKNNRNEGRNDDDGNHDVHDGPGSSGEQEHESPLHPQIDRPHEVNRKANVSNSKGLG